MPKIVFECLDGNPAHRFLGHAQIDWPFETHEKVWLGNRKVQFLGPIGRSALSDGYAWVSDCSNGRFCVRREHLRKVQL